MKIDNIAIITARKGSQRIKNKNLKIFFGKPIIFYSIKALQKSNIFDKIFLSTNCDEIENIARKFGVQDIIRRPNYISNNKVGTITVVNDALKKLTEKKINPKYVCCIYPAAPLTKPKNIIFAYKSLKNKKMDFIYPSTEIKNNDQFLNKKLIKIKKIKKKNGIINDKYLSAGQFWFAKAETWKKSKTVFNKNSYTFIIDERYSDVNNMNDWNRVKKIYLSNKKQYVH